MLTSIVRPMVKSQIKLLAQTQATKITLVRIIAKWLGFLGVSAEVTHLDTAEGKIQVSLTVSQPEASEHQDWHRIIENIESSKTPSSRLESEVFQVPTHLQNKYQRLLAYSIQINHTEGIIHWESIYPKLKLLGIEESAILGIKTALKVPQDIERLVKDLDAEVAALALSQTATIALFDQHVNPEEYQVLQTLIEVMSQNRA